MSHRSHTSLVRALFIAILCASVIHSGDVRAATDPPKTKRPDIYDTSADGKQQIAEALVNAKRDNKRVLLQFGANWCSWCHLLHDLFKSDKEVAKKLLYEYELVLIDIDEVDGKRHNDDVDEKYGRPTKLGLPVLVVLDADGKQLTTQSSEPLEKGEGHDSAKVLAFLSKWQAKPADAKEIVDSALIVARSQSKNLFVHFSAPWCGYCRRLDTFLHEGEAAKLFGSAFVPVKVDVERTIGGEAFAKKYGRTSEDGLPFFAFVDSTGRTLADSRGPKGNVGFPVEPFEIEHFMKLVRAHAPKLALGELAIIESELKSGK